MMILVKVGLLVYVIFDLESITQNQKVYIDNLKHMIIINKNDKDVWI